MKIGMLTSGGDCQALNAAMRGVVKGLSENDKDLEVYGFYDGYKGLIYGNYRLLSSKDFSGILTVGGTILGSSRQPFKQMRIPDENGLDKVEAMKETYYKLNLDCLVILGGNGTQKTANLLREEGLNVIHLPKTIDNDIYGTDVTFGFQSAINVACNAIDCIHTTAASHNRVFIVEVMGHKVGWLTLYAGVASGADIILLPEIPYDIDKVIEAIDYRKDVDGFHPLNVASLWLRQECLLPCTPKGIIRLLKSTGTEIAGKRAVVIGRSNIVGLPVAKLLLDENATVTIAHSRTKNLPEVTREADILVVAIGRPKFVTADMVKPGAVVIDVGVNRDPETGKLCGDVDFAACEPVAGMITKVPGGVGPMTITILLENTIEAFERRMRG